MENSIVLFLPLFVACCRRPPVLSVSVSHSFPLSIFVNSVKLILLALIDGQYAILDISYIWLIECNLIVCSPYGNNLDVNWRLNEEREVLFWSTVSCSFSSI